jgi:serine/threonine-protein kinase RsbT
MLAMRNEVLQINSSEDVVRVRQAVRAAATEIGLSLVDQTKIGGTVAIELVQNGMRRGVRLTFEDQGPGIADLELALKDGYTTGGGLGLGLSGAKRLSNEFSIASKPSEGTRVIIARWK